MKTIIVRLLLTGFVIYLSWVETKAPITTLIFILIFISIEALNGMLSFTTSKAQEISKQMDKILELIEK